MSEKGDLLKTSMHLIYINLIIHILRGNCYSHSCQDGFLRISDNEAQSNAVEWFPPTTVCGQYDPGKVRVRRYTRSPSAFVEFKLKEAKPPSGYEFDVTFIDKGRQHKYSYI